MTSGRFEALLELSLGKNPLDAAQRGRGRQRVPDPTRARACRTATRRWCSPSRRPRSDSATLPVATRDRGHRPRRARSADRRRAGHLRPVAAESGDDITPRDDERRRGDLGGSRHPGVRQLKGNVARHRVGDSFVRRRATSGRDAYRELSGGVSSGGGGSEQAIRRRQRRARPAGALLLAGERLALPIQRAVANATDDRSAEVDARAAARRRALTQEAMRRFDLHRAAVRAAPRPHRRAVYALSTGVEGRLDEQVDERAGRAPARPRPGTGCTRSSRRPRRWATRHRPADRR